MQLSQHFTLAELSSSDTAARHGLDNTPPEDVVANLKKLAELLEKVRNLFNAPITINSGYRSPEVNALVGSKPTSQHCKGEAADIRVPGHTPLEVCYAIKAAQLQYDQCILEFYNSATGTGWTHISVSSNPRRQDLTINKSGTTVGFHA